MGATEDPRIRRLEEAASKWKAELHVRNTFLEARICQDEEPPGSISSKASSDPTHSNISSSIDSWAQSSVDEDVVDVLELSPEGSSLQALALSSTTVAFPTTSVGSALHAEGGCSPCFFFPLKKGCHAGTNCKFCHMAHELLPRTRPSKERRAKAKRLAETVARQSSKVDASMLIAQSVAAASDESKRPSYLQQVILSKLKSDHLSSPSSGQRPNIVSL